jgi:alpha-glucosidase
MGDQLPTFDKHDGMWSALVAQLNGAMSGYTLTHSDIGGYTSINYVVVVIMRTNDLLFRWTEMSCFSDPIMRTHIGLKEDQAQIWDSEETMTHFTKMVNIHKTLKPLKAHLM